MHFNQIIQLMQQSKFEMAAIELEKKIKRDPANVRYLNTLGVLYLQTKQINKGVKILEKSFLINNNQLDVFKNIISGYQELTEIDKAISIIEENLPICDEHIIFKLGYFYNAKNRFDKAIECYKKLNGSQLVDQKHVLYNLAITYENNQAINEAINTYKQCIEIDNQNYQAKFNLAVLYLYKNEFEIGWKYFESRLDFAANKMTIQKPILKNLKVKGKNILIIFEYGIGDQILFSTFLASIDLKKNNYFVKIDQRLNQLIKDKYPDIIIYDPRNESEIDYIVPIASLGKELRPNIWSFDNINYGINLNTKKINGIKKLLPNNKILCGISWKSSNKEIGQFKKINIDKILRGLNIKDIAFVNLQYNSTEEELQEIKKSIKSEIIDLNFDKFNDIEQLACLISCCNFVITTSNITAHLAGIINKDTLVIPPKIHGKLWYWGNHKEKISLWYKNVKIIDNNLNIGDGEILNQIKDHLKIH